MNTKRPLTPCLLVFTFLNLCILGCNRNAEEIESNKFHGPHGGHTLMLSEDVDFEMEFTVDEKGREIVIYVHEQGTQKPFPIEVVSLDAKLGAGDVVINVTFRAKPRITDPAGSSSRFVLSLNDIPQQMLAASRFRLTVSCPVEGKVITGIINHYNNHAHKYIHD
ncbi:MAG: hypothetical protein AAGA30_14330 [Planctomycetota bacterium]